MRIRLPHRTAVAAVTLLTLAAGALEAQSTLDTTLAVRPGARLSVPNLMNGTVTVRQWNRGQIRVQAEYERGRVDLQLAGNELSLRTESRRGNTEVDYVITVPTGTAVDVSSGLSVDVTVSGVCGPVSVTTVSGDIDLSCVEGDATIQTVSGDITVRDARGQLEINATSGDVEIRGARGPVTVHATSGDVTLADISNPELDVETVNGDIDYVGRIMEGGRYRFAAHSGDVSVGVLGNLNASFIVSTFSGDFESEYPIELMPGRAMSNKEMEFRIPNSGGGANAARVRLNSFSGTISLRRGAGGNREE